MWLKRLAVVVMATTLLAACDRSAGPKQTAGTVLGAAGGGLLGAQFGRGDGRLAAVALGTFLGALVGSEVGRSLDRADRLAIERATQRSLETSPSGRPTEWRNPDSGHYGTVTPEPAFKSREGEFCREYQQTVTIGGRTEEAYGTACRQPDGSWKIVNR
jgi:surface antigen